MTLEQDISAIPVAVSEYMVGCKRVVMTDGRMFVSHEMWNRMKDASPEELNALLDGVEVLNLDLTQMGRFPLGPHKPR